MSKKRRAHSAQFKAKVGLEALKEAEPIHVIASRYQVHPVQVRHWRKEVENLLPGIFARPGARQRDEREREQRETQLYARIGQLQMELEWLKKKFGPAG